MNVEILLAVKKWCIDLLANPVTGSVIGLLGLCISVWSLIETKIVKKYVEKEKTVAINKYRFISSKENIIKQLNKQLKSIKELNNINSTVCSELMMLTQKILQYDSIFSKEDKVYLNESKNIYKNLSQKTHYETNECTAVIERTTQITIILEKGEYSK